MNKKLTSVLLSALMISQPAMYMPVYATENTDGISKQSNISEKRESSLAKIILGASCLGGLALLTGFLIHNYRNSSPDSSQSDNNSQITTSVSAVQRRNALNSAVLKLYNSEYRNIVLEFPYDDAKQLLNNPTLDDIHRSALLISITLNEAFRQASADQSAIDLSSNGKLFETLNKNIDANSDLETVLRGIIDASDKFIDDIKKSVTNPNAKTQDSKEVKTVSTANSKEPKTETTTSSKKTKTETTTSSKEPETKTTASSKEPEIKTTTSSKKTETKTTASSKEPEIKTTTSSKKTETKTTASSKEVKTVTTEGSKKKKASSKKESETNAEKPITHNLSLDSEVRENIIRWQARHHIPVRAFKWHHNLCWLHSSLLLFFHNEGYHNFILNFPISKAQEKINLRPKDDNDRVILEAMIEISNIFRELNADPETPALCFNYENTGRAKNLINKLNHAFPILSKDHSANMNFGSYHSQIADELYDLIQKAAKLVGLEVNASKLQKPIYCRTRKDGSSKPIFSGYAYFENQPEVKLVYSDCFLTPAHEDHYWLQLSVDDNKISIGEMLNYGQSIDRQASKDPAQLIPRKKPQFPL